MGTPPLKLQHWSMSDARNFCVSHDNIFCVLGLRSYVMYSCASQSVPWASRKDSALSYQMTDAVCSGLNAIYIFCVRSWFWTALAEFWDSHVDTGAAIMIWTWTSDFCNTGSSATLETRFDANFFAELLKIELAQIRAFSRFRISRNYSILKPWAFRVLRSSRFSLNFRNFESQEMNFESLNFRKFEFWESRISGNSNWIWFISGKIGLSKFEK